jgi:hypothetical protein
VKKLKAVHWVGILVTLACLPVFIWAIRSDSKPSMKFAEDGMAMKDLPKDYVIWQVTFEHRDPYFIRNFRTLSEEYTDPEKYEKYKDIPGWLRRDMRRQINILVSRNFFKSRKTLRDWLENNKDTVDREERAAMGYRITNEMFQVGAPPGK